MDKPHLIATLSAYTHTHIHTQCGTSDRILDIRRCRIHAKRWAQSSRRVWKLVVGSLESYRHDDPVSIVQSIEIEKTKQTMRWKPLQSYKTIATLKWWKKNPLNRTSSGDNGVGDIFVKTIMYTMYLCVCVFCNMSHWSRHKLFPNVLRVNLNVTNDRELYIWAKPAGKSWRQACHGAAAYILYKV